jgi:hypothetical protein
VPGQAEHQVHHLRIRAPDQSLAALHHDRAVLHAQDLDRAQAGRLDRGGEVGGVLTAHVDRHGHLGDQVAPEREPLPGGHHVRGHDLPHQ